MSPVPLVLAPLEKVFLEALDYFQESHRTDKCPHPSTFLDNLDTPNLLLNSLVSVLVPPTIVVLLLKSFFDINGLPVLRGKVCF